MPPFDLFIVNSLSLYGYNVNTLRLTKCKIIVKNFTNTEALIPDFDLPLARCTLLDDASKNLDLA